MDTISDGPPSAAPSVTPPAFQPERVPAVPKKRHGCLGAFLGFCLAVAFLFMISLISLRLTFFNPDFWKTWLSQSRAYESIEQNLLPTIFSSFVPESSTGGDSTSLPMDPEIIPAIGPSTLVPSDLPEKLSLVVKDIVTPLWLQNQAEGAIDGFFLWLSAPEQGLRIAIDLRPLRQPLETGIKELLREQYELMPVCTYSAQSVSVDTEMTCRPAEMTFDQVWEQIQADNPDGLIGTDFPEEYVIDEQQFQAMFDPLLQGQATAPWQNFIQNFVFPPKVYQILMLCLWIGVAIVAGLVGLIILLYRRTVPSLLRILGIPVLVISALRLIGDLVVWLVLGSMFPRLVFLGQTGAGAPTELFSQQQMLADFFGPLINTLLIQVIRPAFWLDGLCLAGAIAMLIVAARLRKKQTRPG